MAERVKKTILPGVMAQYAEKGGGDIILPESVEVPVEPVTVFLNHDYNVPESYLGKIHDVRIEDGELVADVEPVDDRAAQYIANFPLGIAGIVEESTVKQHVRVITQFKLVEVSVVAGPPAKEAPVPEIPDSGFTDVEKARERGKELKDKPELLPAQAVSLVIEKLTDVDLSLDEGEDTTGQRFIDELYRLGFEIHPR